MQEKLIMQELAKKLNSDEGGNCPFDANCGYGFGKSCSADETLIINKMEKIKKESDLSRGSIPGMFMMGSIKEPWPCDECTRITFVEPIK